MNESNPRQQIVDSIRGNSNILVTVSSSPSVDELSAALGLTILLNNLGKRATAVVSGTLPPAITFLDPEKTFEGTVNSLRDFIIALDKEKADHLRYKVDGDVVKIFITPYRTTLTEKDLEFTQGDYNVELVIALGVKDKDHLDKALDAHGRILHDAVVATIMAGDATSTLGGIAWQDAAASSLCEMLVSLIESLKEEKPLLDEQIATALLTGIVSATDRFSNDRTSSRIMTMAAQLMAAGANQQLIAAKLQEAHDIGPDKQASASEQSIHADGTTSLSEGESTRLNKDRKKKKDKKPADGVAIAHDTEPKKSQAADEAQSKTDTPAVVPPVVEPVQSEPSTPPADTEAAFAASLDQLQPVADPPAHVADLSQQLEEAKHEDLAPPADVTAPILPPSDTSLPPLDVPLPPLSDMPPLGDAPAPTPFVAPPTAGISADHSNGGGYLTDTHAPDAPIDGMESAPEVPSSDPFATPLVSPVLPPLQPDPLFDSPHQDAVSVTAPTIQPPADTSSMPDFEETPLPNDPAAVASVPDFAALNPTGLSNDTSAPAFPSLDAMPPPPPLPDFSTLPPLPNLDPVSPPAATPQDLDAMFPPGQAVPPPAAPDVPPAAPPPANQFKIPGQ